LEREARRVVVLGAGGFIGRWVARALGEDGAHVWATARDLEAAQATFASYQLKGTLVALDALSVDDLSRLLKEVRPHTVFNLIGYGVDQRERDADLARAVNEELPRTLVRLLPAFAEPHAGRSLIHAGSALEYGEVGGDLSEETAPNPTTVYGITKLAGTRVVAEAQQNRELQAVVARLFTVYGPGEHTGRLVPTLIEASRGSGRVALSQGTQLRDFTFVEDVAEGFLRLAASSGRVHPVINLCTGTLTSVRRFIEESAAILGISEDRLGFGDVPTRPEEMQHSAVAVSRARDALGWLPHTPIAEGIARTARFLGNVS
jgi:UDP-glucose 4-epimerase